MSRKTRLVVGHNMLMIGLPGAGGVILPKMTITDLANIEQIQPTHPSTVSGKALAEALQYRLRRVAG